MLKNAANVIEEIEIQIAGRNLLRIRSTKEFKRPSCATVLALTSRFFCVGRLSPREPAENYAGLDNPGLLRQQRLLRWKRHGTYV